MYDYKLLLPTDAQAVSQAFFGQGTGPIHLTGVACGSTQNRLIDCPYSTNTSGDTHAEDAGIRCSGPCKYIIVKLRCNNFKA